MIRSEKLRSSIWLWAALTALGPSASWAQGGAIKGLITNAEKNPLRAARILLIGTRIESFTDSLGAYRLSGVPAGHYDLQVRLLGYASITSPVDVTNGTEVDMTIALSSAPVALDTVKVVADSFMSPALRGFEDRRSRGGGRFFTREDVAKMNPRVFTDILRRVPGLQIQSAGGSMNNSEAVRSGRIEGLFGSRVCNVLFYVNGSPFPLQQDFTINHFVSPADVVGIEVYPGASEIPPQFETGAFNPRCGVVVIWTREGSEKKRKR